jgi:hypothetical protein
MKPFKMCVCIGALVSNIYVCVPGQTINNCRHYLSSAYQRVTSSLSDRQCVQRVATRASIAVAVGAVVYMGARVVRNYFKREKQEVRPLSTWSEQHTQTDELMAQELTEQHSSAQQLPESKNIFPVQVVRVKNEHTSPLEVCISKNSDGLSRKSERVVVTCKENCQETVHVDLNQLNEDSE